MDYVPGTSGLYHWNVRIFQHTKSKINEIQNEAKRTQDNIIF